MRTGNAGAPRVAIVTSAEEAALHADEQQILPSLRARGLEAEAVVWNDAAVDWSAFDAAIIRSVWDYFEHYPAFLAWLDAAERVTRVHNPPSLVRWNSDKLYLRDLERRGVRILPTVFCEQGRPADLAALLASRPGWEDAIVKPSVSGGSYRTHRVRAGTASATQPEVDSLLKTSSVLVQPFFPEIQTEGEWSFIFFDGALSHTIVKRPGAKDFRVQPQFGGTYAEAKPSASLIAQVESIVRALPERPAYGRIDGVRRGDDFYLMEAELIEPYLYMTASPGALDRCTTMLERLARGA